jgi:NitT/TauT family transport system ATP-binding protein
MPALAEVSLALGHEELLCVVGPSGCGKTTLLKVVAGLLRPRSGEVVFAAPAGDGPTRAALVFQEHGVFPWMTVLANVMFGVDRRLPRAERARRAREFIARVGLAPFERSYPHELSVGMRQRVAVARAFVASSPILLMDEPFAALDAQTRVVLQEELLRIWEHHRRSVLYVTHDITEAVLLGDRILVMSGPPGRIADEIPVPLERPRDLLDRHRVEIRAIARRIWRQLERDVRRRIGVDP